MQVKVLPTVVYFEDGIAKDRLQGFEGLIAGLAKGKEDEFPTSKVSARPST